MFILPMEPIQPLTLSQLLLPSIASASKAGEKREEDSPETGWKRNAAPETLLDLVSPQNILGLFISLLTRVEASGLDSIFKG